MRQEELDRLSASSKCPICRTDTGKKHTQNSEQGMWSIHCQNCGIYRIDDSALADLVENWSLKKPQYMPLLAYKVRRMQRDDMPPWVGANWLQEVCEGPLEFPNVFEQVENLIIFLAQNLGPGETMSLNVGTCQAAVGATDGQALGWVLLQAFQQDWIQGIPNEALNSDYAIINGTLTLRGWERYSEIGRHRQSRIAFMAMQYNDGELDSLVNGHFRKAVAEAGFDLRLLNDEPEAGIIDNRLRVELRRSRLVIADLTHHNRGAYWEAGFGEGLGLPVIYTCRCDVLNEQGDDKIHFDTRNSLIVPWDPEKPEQASIELKAAIRNTLPDDAIMEDAT